MNIAEILRNCPKGMKLYSPIFGEVEFTGIGPVDTIKINELNSTCMYSIYSDGRYTKKGECILFPSKEQRDWSKFLIPFKDGDVIVTTDQTPRYPYENVAIFEEYNDRTDRNIMTVYCQFDANGEFNNFNQDVDPNNWRKATNKEREEFFERLNNEGYDFVNGNLIKRFRYGDVVAFRNESYGGGYNIGIFDKYLDNRFCKLLCATLMSDGSVQIIDENYKMDCGWDTENARLATTEEIQRLLAELNKIGYRWENYKLVKYKFKVGDTITNGKDIVKITNIAGNFYRGCDINKDKAWGIPTTQEYNWKLAKFDLNSLKPYDRVLTKSNSDSCWYPTLVSYVRSCGNVYVIDKNSTMYYVIPFEGNEHLIGKEDDPDPYYITW